ncbi:Histone H4 [Mucor velutinosus]|uniref:Lon protease homolog n=1 Tax=Mucor velutinosus TaxID=708070 RepID=A0AAN7DIF5_9FUNG|nr:Histone H4 [Mucor velutinosus]
MNNSYPEKLIVVPLESKVLLPSVILRLLIRGKQATDLTKSYFRSANTKSHDIYIACIPMKPCHVNAEETAVMSSQASQVPIPQQDESGLRSGTNLFGVFVEGVSRFRVHQYTQNTPSMAFPGCWMAHVNYFPKPVDVSDGNALQFKELSQIFVLRMKELQLPDTLLAQLTKVVNTMPPSALADLLVCLIETTFDERLLMLSTVSLDDRLQKACEFLTRQLHVLHISDNLGAGIDGKLSKKQREFYLRQQLEAIQDELGDDHKKGLPSGPQEEDELSDLHKRLVQANLPNEVVTIAQRELKRIRRLQPSSSEWAVSRNYLEWLADLPWSMSGSQQLDIQRSKQQLDQDHFGLKHVKKRIIEYLSVIKLKGDLKAPILCLVGPPGIGKTSLGRSIAQSMSREFHRISLGGVRDEADMRGHRRTYVGAMPGLIIQGLRKCKVNNPLMLLDEIDKLAHSSHYGDPAAALLEVLDPEQNCTFSDHYLNVPFDLSNILFIATANSLDTIPEPLLDRMEVIELHGYTFEEKLHIAKSHLIPKQVKAHGLQIEQVKLADEVILYIAENFTRESGVRNLERTLASVVRAKCVEIADLQENQSKLQYNPSVSVKDVEAILGNIKFEKEVSERESYPGVVTGLAYSGSGNGGILFVEASKMPGDGHLHLTGSLGNVIQESAKLALSWVKSHAYALKLTSHPKEKMVQDDDIHIHFPSGSIPKDGPSAGVTLVCALVSLYSGNCVPNTTAMTGEISLRGQVLPVGGIKEKVISAHRAGIRKIVIPTRNQKDVETDVPKTVRDEIQFCYAKNIWQVLEAAFDNHQLYQLQESHL